MIKYACLLTDTGVFDPDNLQSFDETYDPDTDYIWKIEDNVAYLVPKWLHLRYEENDYE